MNMSKETFEGLREKYKWDFTMAGDMVNAINFCIDLMIAEAEATRKTWPHIESYVELYNSAAYELFRILPEIEDRWRAIVEVDIVEQS